MYYSYVLQSEKDNGFYIKLSVPTREIRVICLPRLAP